MSVRESIDTKYLTSLMPRHLVRDGVVPCSLRVCVWRCLGRASVLHLATRDSCDWLRLSVQQADDESSIAYVTTSERFNLLRPCALNSGRCDFEFRPGVQKFWRCSHDRFSVFPEKYWVSIQCFSATFLHPHSSALFCDRTFYTLWTAEGCFYVYLYLFILYVATLSVDQVILHWIVRLVNRM